MVDRNIDPCEPEHPRCSGCGTRDHSEDTRCPNQPDVRWPDDYGDHQTGDFEL